MDERTPNSFLALPHSAEGKESLSLFALAVSFQVGRRKEFAMKERI